MHADHRNYTQKSMKKPTTITLNATSSASLRNFQSTSVAGVKQEQARVAGDQWGWKKIQSRSTALQKQGDINSVKKAT